WAIHPGGPRILNAVAETVGFEESLLSPSREVLARYGNMSSPTVLFILKKLQEEQARLPCVMLGFGPGLTIEAALINDCDLSQA
ncbi:MAG: 3-oxoacyl-[acyl-carrier-protein] synthase III C-terminal domain-containing protein, partial [Gimesia chilikensis]